MKSLFNQLVPWLGISQASASHSEKLLSATGGFIAIFAMLIISQAFLGLSGSAAIVASMGASAVLLFAVPHGPLSQPWSLIGGHLTAAAVGVACASLIDDRLLAAGSAVGLAIAAMYYLKCIHPPGGATALTAVLGGEGIHNLGYQFILTPVLLNLLVILFVAVIFNALFHWRRYPAYLQPKETKGVREPAQAARRFSHEDFIHALKEIDSFVDVNEYELRRIFDLADLNAQQRPLTPEEIEVGGLYSNGDPGVEWRIRQVVNINPEPDSKPDSLWFININGRRSTQPEQTTREAFARWARYRVEQDNGCWRRCNDREDNKSSKLR